MADRLVSDLGLADCVVYLYDGPRANLVAVAESAPGGAQTLEHRDVIPLEPGTSLADFEFLSGQPGGGFSLPLYDTRRVLGVVCCRLRPDQVAGADQKALARAIVLGFSVALSRAGNQEPVGDHPQASLDRSGLLPSASHLYRYLADAVARTCAGDSVSLALLRLSGAGCRGCLPTRGREVATSGSGPRLPNRVFGFGAESDWVGLVWLRVGRSEVRAALETLVSGAFPLESLIGGNPDGRRETHVTAAGMTVYPDDATDGVALLEGASVFLDLQTYLMAKLREGRDTVYGLTGDTAAMVMDSHFLAQEIDRQRQVLEEAVVASGLSFQDSRVKEISERLDRLIVAMQRFMGHRGAVPKRGKA